jgi:TRAP-type C4-dicarboxylate transport system substrate-binding protein
MHMFKSLFIFIAISCAFTGAHAQTQVLKWAHVYEPNESYHVQAVQAANEIARLTQGRVRIEVIPASKAGAEETFPAKLKSGEIGIAYLGMTHATKDYPPLAVSGFPFIFQDTDHVRRYLVSPFFQEQLDGYEKAVGNHMVTAVYYGARHVTANRPIAQPQDMVGLKLRVPGAPAYKLFGQAMQAQTTR